MVHRQAGAQQAKHHRNKAPGHEARRALIEVLGVRVRELSEEDPLRAVQQCSQIAGGIHQTAKAKDQLLKMRPDHGHQRADEYRRQ